MPFGRACVECDAALSGHVHNAHKYVYIIIYFYIC
jgi:hypothetical protein